MNRETEGLVGGSLKMSKQSKAGENAGTTGEEREENRVGS